MPCGKKTSAPAQTPSVPTSVTASALTPSLISRWATGRDDLGPEGAESFHHGGGRLPTGDDTDSAAHPIMGGCAGAPLPGTSLGRWSSSVSRPPSPASRPVPADTAAQGRRRRRAPCRSARSPSNPATSSARALCGSIRRDWDPDHPAAGKVKVGFAFVPARTRPGHRHAGPARGRARLRHHRSGSSYVHDVRRPDGPPQPPARRPARHRRSEPIRCPRMQNMTQPFNVAAGQCGKSLGQLARRLLDGALGRRPGRRPRGARARRRRRLRRLLRHVLRAGVRRSAPRPGPQRLARRVVPDLRRVGLVPDVPADRTPVLPPRLPALPGLPERRPAVQRRHQAGARQGPRPAVAWPVARRRRPADAGAGQPVHAGGRRVLRDVHAGVLPRADRCPALRAARRPRAPAPAGRRGDRRRHRLRARAVLQRRPRGGGRRATTTRTSTT